MTNQALTTRLVRLAVQLWGPPTSEGRTWLRLAIGAAVADAGEDVRAGWETVALPADPSEQAVGNLREAVGRQALDEHSGNVDAAHVNDILNSLSTQGRTALLDSAIRAQVGSSTPDDQALIKEQFDNAPTRKAIAMSDNFYQVDTTSLPSGFDGPTFIGKVNENITAMGIQPKDQAVLRSGIIGMLLLDGNNDPTVPTFGDQIRNRLWNYVQAALLDSNGVPVPSSSGSNGSSATNKDAFVAVDGVIRSIRGAAGNAYYQELATAARQIIDGQRGAIISNQILLSGAVQVALQGYGAGTSTQGSFELPPLTGGTTGGGDDEIIPDHIRGVAMLYAAYQLDVMGLIKVVDRNVEIFMNGQLPVSNDMGGNALNAYYWDTVNRMSESARWMQYGRVLGAKGADVSKEVQPNSPFDNLFLSFLSALAEYNRQQSAANLLGNSRALSLTAENVRKKGRDLAANCTLYGYGYTQFAAKKLQYHIQTSLNILRLPDVTSAWGVQSAWQVVERVSSQEFKATPNIVKYRTMAESGKKILDLVASNSSAWSAISNNPLFNPDPVNTPNAPCDISPDDQSQLMRHTEYWLAVNGVKDQDVVQSSQPSDTAVSPSIPSLDGAVAGGGDIAGQIQNMLQTGQTPTPDQLRHMVGL
jgi:hypothetical protein